MKIYENLLKFQQMGISLKKDGKNPHFKSDYVTLNEVLAKVKKPLNDLGILIIQKPASDGLTTMLIDKEDGSNVECFLPFVEASTAQKIGSNITYNRRYSLVSLLALDDEDDDGEKASETKKSKAPAKNTDEVINFDED